MLLSNGYIDLIKWFPIGWSMENEDGRGSLRKEKVGGLQRGVGEDIESYLSRLRMQLDGLALTSRVHQAWFTHRNHAGCWICDSILCGYVLLEEFDRWVHEPDAYAGEEASVNILSDPTKTLDTKVEQSTELK